MRNGRGRAEAEAGGGPAVRNGHIAPGTPGGPRPRAAGRVAAVVLAAGASARMGRNKLLLDLNGEAVVRRAARTAIGAGLEPVIVVTGHAHEAVAGRLRGLRCRTVFNGEHAAGTHTSVAAGIGAAAEAGCAAAVVMLADMPLVTPAMLRSLVGRHRESGAPLVASRYGGEVNAPPVLYDRRLFGELRRMDARCGREVVRRHRREAIEVAWPAEAARDLDRPADYEWVRRKLAEGAPAAAFSTPPDPPPPTAPNASPRPAPSAPPRPAPSASPRPAPSAPPPTAAAPTRHG